jgi:hypothetical protein
MLVWVPVTGINQLPQLPATGGCTGFGHSDPRFFLLYLIWARLEAAYKAKIKLINKMDWNTWMAFFSLECTCSVYLEYILSIIKMLYYSYKKCCAYIVTLTCTCSLCGFKKTRFLCGMCKKDKIHRKNRVFLRSFFVLFAHAIQNVSFFYRISSKHMECGDLRGK